MKEFTDIYNNIIIEDNNKSLLQKFFNKPWTLREELQAILPVINKKVQFSMSNMFGSDIPGELKMSDCEITGIDKGSQTPGFEIKCKIQDSYKAKIIKSLKLTNIAKNEVTEFGNNVIKNDLGLIITLNVSKSFNKSENDLSDVNAKIEKFSIKRWSGEIELAAFKTGTDKPIDILHAGTIEVDVDIDEDSISKTLLKKMEENKSTGGNFYSFFIDSLFTLATRKKSNKEKIKKDGITAEISVDIEISKNLKISKKLNTKNKGETKLSPKEKLQAFFKKVLNSGANPKVDHDNKNNVSEDQFNAWMEAVEKNFNNDNDYIIAKQIFDNNANPALRTNGDRYTIYIPGKNTDIINVKIDNDKFIEAK